MSQSNPRFDPLQMLDADFRDRVWKRVAAVADEAKLCGAIWIGHQSLFQRHGFRSGAGRGGQRPISA